MMLMRKGHHTWMAIKNDQDGGDDEGVSDLISLDVCAELDRVKTSHDSNWSAMNERKVKQFDSPYIYIVG